MSSSPSPAPSRPIPSVAALVVTWNSAKVIGGLLDSLASGFEGVDWHAVIADNDSSDDTVARIGSWSSGHAEARVEVVHTGGNLGYAAGINAALARADRYDAVLVLNPDIRLHAGCVRRMLDFIEAGAHADEPAGEPAQRSGTRDGSAPESASTSTAHPRTGIVVPRIVDEDGALAPSLRREPTLLRALGEATLGARAGKIAPLGELVLDEATYARPTVADWATGAIMLISKDCLDACGPWDESFFLYSEETEYALRARDRGFLTRLAPQATATHIGGESKVSPELWTLLMSNRIKLYRRRHNLPASVAYWGAALLREAPRAAMGHPRSKRAVRALLAPKPLMTPTEPQLSARSPAPDASRNEGP